MRSVVGISVNLNLNLTFKAVDFRKECIAIGGYLVVGLEGLLLVITKVKVPLLLPP